MALTEAVLQAFIHCPLKAHYVLSGRTLRKNDFDEFDEPMERMHLDRGRIELGLRLEISTNLPLVRADLCTRPPSQSTGENCRWIDPVARKMT
jgi:hypothetical protein